MFADPPSKYGCYLCYNNSSLSSSFFAKFSKAMGRTTLQKSGKFKLPRKTADICKLPSIMIMSADLGHFVNGYLTRLDITPFWPLKL